MSKLILMFNKQVLKEFPFDKEILTVGRKPENDIQIDNLAVSGKHAKIEKSGSDFILVDLQSTNGTFVNNKKITSYKLKHGDNIIIGKHVLLFIAAKKGQEDTDESEEIMDRTMLLDTADQQELLSEQGDSEAPRQPEKIGVLSFLGGSKEGEIELTRKLVRIGKAENSEIRLSGLLMGATAATISRRPSGYAISFAGGMTKLKVNNEVVKDSVPLKDFDTIEIGSYKFQFYQKEGKKA